MSKIVIGWDMDDTLCHYSNTVNTLKEHEQHWPQSEPDFYNHVRPIPQAVTAFRWLEMLGYDCKIITAPNVLNVNTYTGKANWVVEHLGDRHLDNLYIVPDKNVVKLDFLIDNDERWARSPGNGLFIHMPYMGDHQYDYVSVVEKIRKHVRELEQR